jgi:hypothetical protein
MGVGILARARCHLGADDLLALFMIIGGIVMQINQQERHFRGSSQISAGGFGVSDVGGGQVSGQRAR